MCCDCVTDAISPPENLGVQQVRVRARIGDGGVGRGFRRQRERSGEAREENPRISGQSGHGQEMERRKRSEG